MNRPDKAGEPSMEEILASIRQIIADDPSPDKAAPVVETSAPALKLPNVEAKPDAKPAESRGAPPLIDRLNGVLKNGPLPPTSPFGSKRPATFDQDLADMFDDGDAPTSGSSSAAPKPDFRVAPELSSTVNGKSSPSPAPADPVKEVDAASVLPPQLSSAGPSVPPPFGVPSSGPKTETPAPAPPRTFGFPPLRKQGGFYPAQAATPVLPPIPSDAPRNGVAAAPAEASANASSSETGPANGFSGFGSIVPGEVAAGKPASRGLFGAPAFSTATMPETRVPTPDLSSKTSDEPPAKTDTDSLPPLGMPASFTGRSIPDPVVEPSKTSSGVEAAPVSPAPSSSATPFAAPFGGSASLPSSAASSAPMARTEPRFDPEPGQPSAVAAQALDALAQGLAASAAASALSGAAQPAVALKPVIDAADASRGPAPQGAAIPPASTPPAGRTLEDAVADMLRPMLQQWVSDNMPRIIERALRVEVAKTTKPGSNS